MQQDAVFEVRVSFLELYNEEIYDLLSVADNNTGLMSLHYSNRKGSVLQGQEEVLVSSKKEVIIPLVEWIELKSAVLSKWYFIAVRSVKSDFSNPCSGLQDFGARICQEEDGADEAERAQQPLPHRVHRDRPSQGKQRGANRKIEPGGLSRS